MADDQHDAPLDYHDDNRVLRYLLHTVKGISPVSGGIMGEALEEEYKEGEEETRPELDPDLDFEV